MCYHVKKTAEVNSIANEFTVELPKGNYQKIYKPEIQCTGFSFPWVMALANSNPFQLIVAKWWLLLPNQTKFHTKGYNTLNTRIENWWKNNTICRTFGNNRALVFVDGYYEWQHKDGKKIKHLIEQKNQKTIMLCAVYNEWFYDEVNAKIKTLSIITRPPNNDLKEIHDRMPLIIHEKYKDDWLQGTLSFEEIYNNFDRYDVETKATVQ